MIGGFDLSQLDEGDSERPDVSLVVVWTVLRRLAHDHFRSHPGGKEGVLLKSFNITRQKKDSPQLWIFFLNQFVFHILLTSKGFQ